MEPITRGTTPTVAVTMDTDLTGYTCYLSIGKARKPYLTVSTTEIASASEGESLVVFSLSQQDTLALKAGTLMMQVRAIKDDEAIATSMVDVEVLDVVNQSVIEDVE